MATRLHCANREANEETALCMGDDSLVAARAKPRRGRDSGIVFLKGYIDNYLRIFSSTTQHIALSRRGATVYHDSLILAKHATTIGLDTGTGHQ